MKKKKSKNYHVFTGNIILLVSFILLVFIFSRAYYLATSEKIDGVNIKEFALSRTTRTENLYASRGKILDSKGETLAENVYSYTLIAYLSPKRTTDINHPQHVVDKELTAEKLSTVIDMSYENILALLSKENLYQTEFGKAGKGLSELQKEKILSLGLPGLGFIETQTRYYPNGSFLSYALGYVKNTEDGEIKGEMGIEKAYNEELSGKDGYITYQKDRNGYKISGTDEVRVEAEDGNDVYLTIDSTVQLFTEQAIANSASKYRFERMNIIVANAKTGAILSMAQYPSFDPNIRNITNYLDSTISIGIEPGSTTKIYTYMCAMEAGVYNGQDTFMSGAFTAQDGTVIGDANNKKGWGVITYDRGLALSSNVGIANLLTKYINRQQLGNYFSKLGFGEKTGIELPNESSGKLSFTYETEVINAGFGQGILITPIQNIKALTSISNNGILLQPYIVDKIVSKNGEIKYLGEKTEIGQVASPETVKKIKELMRTVITEGTGSIYGMDGYDIIAKTGTAQIATENGTGYLQGKYDVIRGFAGLYPGDDPEIIIYASMTKPQIDSAAPLADIVKEIIVNLTEYYGIKIDKEKDPIEKLETISMPTLYNKDLNEAINILEKGNIEPVVLGEGDKVIKAYPKENEIVTNKSKVFLLTNSSEIKMPNLYGYSSVEVKNLFELLGINIEINGTGYVYEQNIPVGTIINKETYISVNLKKLFDIQ